ncbi:hypothetical protein AK830_g5932 [Neonectria ditissima]|uniref:C2H2-type domain-containing protein n=1 Tax=Neonectria ditissima TaxID=78410 RepID=A0A0P7BJR4_9HYPO|nr:hypothetical protein AK830_g5932 [Neonectria ditissima]
MYYTKDRSRLQLLRPSRAWLLQQTTCNDSTRMPPHVVQQEPRQMQAFHLLFSRLQRGGRVSPAQSGSVGVASSTAARAIGPSKQPSASQGRSWIRSRHASKPVIQQATRRRLGPAHTTSKRRSLFAIGVSAMAHGHGPSRRSAHLRILVLRCCEDELSCSDGRCRYLTAAQPDLGLSATSSWGSQPQPSSPQKPSRTPYPAAAAHDYLDGECRAENVPNIDRQLSRIALVARMPSVRDKASQFSFHRHRNILSSASPKNPRSSSSRAFSRWLKAPHRFDILLKNRCPKSDMPRVGEEQVFVTREKASPSSAKASLSDNPLNVRLRNTTTSSDPDHSASTRDAEERVQNRIGSPASRRGHLSRTPPVANDNIGINVSQSSIQERRAADSKQSDVKLSAPSAAYLEHQINQQLRYRKKRIVESLMAAIVECIEKKLETLEDGGDGGNPRSPPSSSGFRSGKRTSQAAGQKRQHRRDDGGDDENDGDDDDGSRKNKNTKKAKTMNDDTRLRFACPYYKRDPQRFKDHRTCLGPGWTDVHRVKEHLRRSHSLPPHQCHRCCRYFDKDDQLKSHQRSAEPCPIKDPKTVCRNLTDGYDQEQGKKLQKRVQKTSEEKWKEWYCILFEVDLDSSDIPSPYHDILYQNGGSSVSQASNFQEYREFYLSRVTPVIRHHVEQEVEKVILAVEDDIKSNVMDVIRDLPRRIMESIPPPGPLSEDESYESLLTLDGIEFALEDGYDFADQSGPDPLMSEFSASEWSDPAAPSSASSVEDDPAGAYYSGLEPAQWKDSRLGTDGIFADTVFPT